MVDYQVIAQAPGRIGIVLNTLRIRPAGPRLTPEVAIKNQARFYAVPVVTTGGQTAWFKAGLQRSPWLQQSLREEIRVQRAFADYELAHRPDFDSPSYLQSGDDRRGFAWLLRKYWTGQFAGNMDDSFGLTDVFLRQVSPGRMAKVLADVRAMTGFMKRRLKPPVHNLSWYLLDWGYYRQHFFRRWLGHRLNPGWRRHDLDRLENWLRRQRPFIARHTTVFTHGDLYPNNIMIRRNPRPVVLFDWELTHLNLPTFDPVMIYLQAWRRPGWQRAFRQVVFRQLGASPATQLAWRLAMVSLATRLTAFCWFRLTNGQPERYPPLPVVHRPTIRRLYRLNLAELTSATAGINL